MEMTTAILPVLLMGFVSIVASQTAPGLPVFTSVEIKTSEDKEGAVITVEYLAPDEPYVLWYINGLPIADGGAGYTITNQYGAEGQKGKTIVSSERDKSSIFAVNLHNFDGENCLILAPLPEDGVVREELDFPWPELTPETASCRSGGGETSPEEEEVSNHWKHDASATDCKASRDGASGGLVFTYQAGTKLQLHAPALDTPHRYVYCAMLLSKNPSDPQDNLVQAMTRDMEGGEEGDVVTLGPGSDGRGWTIETRTDRADYEGVLLLNTTYLPQSDVVMASFLIQPFTVQRADHSAPFTPGFVAAFPNPVTWLCRAHTECMVVCPFVHNGDLSVTFSRQTVGSGPSAEPAPVEAEESVGFIKMLGPFLGYSAIFIPAFEADRHTGTFKCTYKTDSSTSVATVEVF